MTQEEGHYTTPVAPPQTSRATPHLGVRVAVRFVVMTALVIAILFLPAGTVRWWQGWVFLVTYVSLCAGLFFVFLKTDPELVKRRLPAKEQVPEQKWIIRFAGPLLAGIYTLPGFDHRLGWSARLWGEEPAWFQLVSLAMSLGAMLAMAWVMWTNRFAGRTIRVEEGQKVITSGPYRFVRHPMYAFSLVMFVFALLALGSYVSLPALLLFLPIGVLRILNEEKVLRAELTGYAEYCEKTRWRLVPGAW